MGNPANPPVPQSPGVPTPSGELIVTVMDPAANPLPGSVTVKLPSGDWTIDCDKKTGIARFSPIPVGKHKVIASHTGHGPVPSGGNPFKPGPVEDTVNVTPSPDITERNAILTLPRGYLRVQVRKTDHKTPLPNVPTEVPGLGAKKTDSFGIADYGSVPPGVFFDIFAGEANPTKKPFFGKPDASKGPAILDRVDSKKSLAVGEVATIPLELEEKKLEIIKLDDHFAPSKENLDIHIAVLGLEGRVIKLVIEGENYAGKIMVERDLKPDETKDTADRTLTWDGKIEVGAKKDQFANPLLGPFKVRISHDDAKHLGVLKDEKPFKILYHSIELNFGKHTPDGAAPPESEQTKFVQFKLNELNYDAGPVNGTVSAVTTNAVRRFQRANYQAGVTPPVRLTVNGTIDATLISALKAASPRQVFEPGKSITQDSKFYIYDNFMNDPNAAFVQGALTEFGASPPAGNRKTFAENLMERPFIPLEVEVKLLNKAGSGVSAPDAVGEVPVSWEVNDAPEDTSVLAGATAEAKTFIKRAREIGATATVAGAARIDGNGDNALDTFDGVRKSTDAAYIQSWFPNDSGNKLDPFSIDRYDSESRAGKTFHCAVVKAFWDAAKHARCKGRAGIYFRFSFKGGDNAKVRAALFFKGLPNEATLVNDHKSVAANLIKETGRWTVWRRTRISAYCPMVNPPPRTSGLPDWADIRDRWKQAFIEVENNGNPLQNLVYTTVVPEATYKAAITGMPSPNSAGSPAAAALIYRPTAVYGGAIPAQGAAETALAYVNRARTVMQNWCRDPINALLKVIHDHARLTSPEGFVIFDFRVHDPITGRDPDGAGGFKPGLPANPAARNVTSGVPGYVRCSGAVTMNVDNPYNVNCYLCHECGHARFLYHHTFVNEAPSSGTATSANASHHDADQPKCTMSYAVPPDTPDQWRYHFCGKCLLRLRGWDVTTSLPSKYT